ncbi:hypothetical protein EMN47_03935 [Prolixibacteraceae bacterium JC049]|nr:hypothetical protein [Prolixibacteraceae bacterium JC049]
MQLELNVSTITDLITFSSAFMLGVLFMISKSENKKANVYLGLFLISLALEVLDVLSESITGLSIGVVQTSLFTLPF